MRRIEICLFLLLLSLLCSFIETRCPNMCSGHGLCGVGNTCSCFEGWSGGAADCSFRNCPTGTAWADKAYATDKAHQVAECSNAGICDRISGTCKCFDGFTGAACQRSTSYCLFLANSFYTLLMLLIFRCLPQ